MLKFIYFNAETINGYLYLYFNLWNNLFETGNIEAIIQPTFTKPISESRDNSLYRNYLNDSDGRENNTKQQDRFTPSSADRSMDDYTKLIKQNLGNPVPVNETSTDEAERQAGNNSEKTSSANNENTKNASSTDGLTDEERAEVRELQQTDAEVKAHESAHIAAGGSLVRGGASFEYQKGPDGKQYAVGGEVHIDISKVSGDPEATIRKMQKVRTAALAPADPSSQDRMVAARASSIEAQARTELSKQRAEASQSTNDTNNINFDNRGKSSENSNSQKANSESSTPSIYQGSGVESLDVYLKAQKENQLPGYVNRTA